MTALTYPEKLPADGKRVLSGPEAMMRNSAMECMDADHPTACTGQVHVGIFFDGTGNNRDWPNAAFPDTGAPPGYTTTNQVALGRHSNVVRLYNAYKRKEVKGRYAYYVPGLGTPNLDGVTPGCTVPPGAVLATRALTASTGASSPSSMQCTVIWLARI
jgi:hypothetical protein